jgi:hypothetical protein
MKLRYKAVYDLNRELPLYYALETILSELSDSTIPIKIDNSNCLRRFLNSVKLVVFYNDKTA